MSLCCYSFLSQFSASSLETTMKQLVCETVDQRCLEWTEVYFGVNEKHAKCRLQPHHFEVISSANSGSACEKNGRTCVACRFFLWSFGNIMLMKEIPNDHLGCIKHCKRWDIYHINWSAGFLPSTVVSPCFW